MNHYVYFIRQAGKGNQPMKVGYSNDPDVRIKSLQTGNPNRLYLSAAIPCENEKDARKFERTLHWLFQKKYKRLMGEWFTVYGSIPELIFQAQKLCRKDNTVRIEKIKYFSKRDNLLKIRINKLKKHIKLKNQQLRIKDEQIDLLTDELESIDRNYL